MRITRLSKFAIWSRVYAASVVRLLGNAFLAMLRILLWPRRRPLDAERVCVYRIGAIGDLICSTPAIYAIRRTYPNAHLTLLTTPGKYSRSRHAEELLAGAGWLDEVMTYDLEEIRRFKDRLAFGKKLRARKFDAWFDLTLDRAKFLRMLRDILMARLLGTRWAIGWRLEHVGFAARAEAEVREFPDEVERLALMLRSCGIEGDATIFPPFVDEPRISGLAEIQTCARPLVAIAPGARRPCNLWPNERFTAVCEKLMEVGATVILLGAPNDQAACLEIAAGAGGQPINLVGKLSLRESRALLRRCDLLICVDSGPQHLAASVGTRCVAIFSQRNQRRRWYPHGRQHVVLEGSVPCHTCLLDVCPNHNLCINQITVEQVIAAARCVLPRASRPRTGRANLSRQSVAQ